MYCNVVEVTPMPALTLFVRFADGLAGSVRFLPSHLIGVFTPLQSQDFFKQVFIDNGAVTWPGEIDLAPDTMYNEIKAHGEWLLT